MSETGVKFSLASFSIAGCNPFPGLVREDRVVALSALDAGPLQGTMLDILDRWDDALPRLIQAAERWAQGDRDLLAMSASVHMFDIQAPLVPRQIFAIGANYRKHVIDIIMADPDMRAGEIAEAPDEATRRALVERLMDERAQSSTPYAFNKIPSAVAGPFSPLTLPEGTEKVDWECELAVLIGRPARHVSEQDANQYIAGYAIANDVTARDLVFRRDVKILGTDWVSSKCQPGFMPFGPYIVPAHLVDPMNVRIQLSVNGRIMQDEGSNDMLIPIARQIAYLSSRVQLMPGDVICTGSPSGNGSHHGVFLKPGDEMIARISGLGEQRVLCR